MSAPRASVVLAVYDAAWCIRRALDSALAQTVPPAEIVVCDDGSSDGTPDLVEREYAGRVRVLRLPHRNASAARREGLEAATGEWLAFLDADDWWEPEKLERQLAFAARHPGVRWLCTDGWYESEHGVLAGSWLAGYFARVEDRTGDLFPELVQRCFPLMSSMLVEREAYRAAGGLDPAIVYSHDYDLWLRLAARWPGAVMAERLVHYWTHPGALSRRFEGRYRDDLALLARIERGELRHDPAVRALARGRRASHAYDLGMLCLRTGRGAEGRALLRRALDAGPLARRAAALAGVLTPDALLPRLRRLPWLRRALTASREPARRVRTRAAR